LVFLGLGSEIAFSGGLEVALSVFLRFFLGSKAGRAVGRSEDIGSEKGSGNAGGKLEVGNQDRGIYRRPEKP
jgi:hypothetical protein